MHELQRASLDLPVCLRLGNSSNQSENSDFVSLPLHWMHCHNCQQRSHRARSAFFRADFVFINCVNEFADESFFPQSRHVLFKAYLQVMNTDSKYLVNVPLYYHASGLTHQRSSNKSEIHVFASTISNNVTIGQSDCCALLFL